jgi:PIN domain nuclease of toxin-antitoxin system
MILLDTHVLVWSQLETRRLSRAASSALQRAERSGGVSISVISLVELANLFSRGRVDYSGNIEASLREYTQNLIVLPITLDIAVLTAHFPPDFPSDPMDRIIAATARAEGIPLVTADERMQNCPLVKTIW